MELFERSVEMTRPSVSSDWLMFLRSRSREAEPSPAAWWGEGEGGERGAGWERLRWWLVVMVVSVVSY